MVFIPFKGEETEVQRGLKTCQTPHCVKAVERRLAPVSVPICYTSLEKPVSPHREQRTRSEESGDSSWRWDGYSFCRFYLIFIDKWFLKTFEWFSYGVDLTLELYVVLFLQSRKKNNQKHFADLSCEFQALPCCLVLTVRRYILSLGADSFGSREQSYRWLPWPWFVSVTTSPPRGMKTQLHLALIEQCQSRYTLQELNN